MVDAANPSLWKLLPPSDAADAARADQDARWQAGKPLAAEKYLDALPRVASDPELALVLIYGEVLSRTAAGESPTLDEYRRRFPRLADRLAVQFQLHSALGKVSDDPDATRPTDDTLPVSSPADPDAELPSQYGPYTAGGVIGRGGMGVVLSARDPALDREVAVKTLRPGHPKRAEAAVRFARESRISAKVQHPGVPAVYAAGELADGTPYLAMKLIRGRTLADLLRDRPDLPRLVRVFEQVAQAVGCAHAQGVVHRDLKPANVMVGEFGEVQVMDWGLARELRNGDCGLRNEDDTDQSHDLGDDPSGSIPQSAIPIPQLTQEGTVLGTPAYMAPEQARGEDADARADVFALGGLLAEILTGAPPFAGGGREAVMAAALGDVAAVRERLAGCGADADLVALAAWCLQPVPSDRPADGAAVAEAVAGYHAAADERVRTAERAAAAAAAQAVEQRKRRRVQLALAAAVGVLLLGGGAAAWVVQKQNADRELAETKVKAEREAARVRAADGVDRGIAQAAELRKRGLWKQADAALAQATAAAGDTPEPEWTARLTAAKGELDLLRKLDAARLDRVFWQGRKGQKAKTDARYAALYREHGFDVEFGDVPAVAAAIDASPIRAELLAALDDWTFGADTKETAMRVLAVARAAAGKSWRELLNTPDGRPLPLTARQRLDAVPTADRTPALYLAAARWATLDGADDAAVVREGLEQFPADFWLLVDLGLIHDRRGEHALALATFAAARALRPDAAQVLNEMGVMHDKMDDLPAAVRFYRQGLAMDESAHTLSNLGNTYGKQKHRYAAVVMHLAAAVVDPEYANAWINLGAALRSAEFIVPAVLAFRKAIALDPADPAPRFNLGLLRLTARNDPKAALDMFQPIIDKKLDMDADQRAKLYRAMGEAYFRLKKFALAEEYVRSALDITPNDPDLHFELAGVQCEQGRPKLAIASYRKAIDLNPNDAKYHTDLGVELRKQGDVEGAIECYDRAIKLKPKWPEAHLNKGTAYLAQREYVKAEKCFRKALELDKHLAEARFNLGCALVGQRRWEDGDAELSEALRMKPEFAPRVKVLREAMAKERKETGK